jgi:hypothetical protein
VRRKVGTPALAIALALAPAAAARAAPGPAEPPPAVEASAEVALGSRGTYPGWVPVLVTLRNVSAEAVVARARLETTFRWQGDAPAHEARRDVPLAPGATKRLFLYGYLTDDSERFVLEVERPGGGRLAQRAAYDLEVRDPGANGYFGGPQTSFLRIGVFSRGPSSALAFLGASSFWGRPGVQRQIEVLPLSDPASLPDRRIGYAPLDALVLADAPLEALSPEQRRAIRDWTLGGGKLVLSPGADASWLGQPFFHDLLPAGKPVAETRRRFLAGTGAVPRFLGFSIEGAEREGEPLVRDDGGIALATRWHAGLGEVILIAFDVDGPIGTSKAAREAFWAELVRTGLPPRPERGHGRWPVGAPVSDATAHRLLAAAGEGTPILPIAAIALLYVAAIGPANFFFLRRRGREPLLVATIPAIAGVFTAGTFAAGYAWKGIRLRVREISRIEARIGERAALRTRIVGLAPAFKTRVAIGLEQGEAGVPVDATESRWDRNTPPYVVDLGERLAIRELPLMPWELGVVEAESVIDLDGAVRVAPRGDGTVDIVNDTPRTLRRVVVLPERVGMAGLLYAPEVPPHGHVRAVPPTTEIEKIIDAGGALVDRALGEAVRTAAEAQEPALIAAIDPPPAAGEGRSPHAGEEAAILVLHGGAP